VITDLCVLILLYMRLGLGVYICVLILLYMCPHTAIYVARSQAKNQVISETEGLLDKDAGEAGSFYRTCLNEQVNKRDLRMPVNRPANACKETR
jgi:hypothetical protein